MCFCAPILDGYHVFWLSYLTWLDCFFEVGGDEDSKGANDIKCWQDFIMSLKMFDIFLKASFVERSY